MAANDVTEPAVQALIAAINAELLSRSLIPFTNITSTKGRADITIAAS